MAAFFYLLPRQPKPMRYCDALQKRKAQSHSFYCIQWGFDILIQNPQSGICTRLETTGEREFPFERFYEERGTEW